MSCGDRSIGLHCGLVDGLLVMRSFVERNFRMDYVCSEMPFRGGCCVEASQLVCVVGMDLDMDFDMDFY